MRTGYIYLVSIFDEHNMRIIYFAETDFQCSPDIHKFNPCTILEIFQSIQSYLCVHNS